MDNRDWQVGHYREMADDDYFNRLAGKRRFKNQDEQDDYEQAVLDNMDECEKCKSGLLDYVDCGVAACRHFECLDYPQYCGDCDLSGECLIYKKAHKAEVK